MREFIHIVEGLSSTNITAYHAGPPGIESFHVWTHFGTLVSAKQRARDRRLRDAVIYRVRLDITNPLRVSDLEASDEAALLNSIARGNYPDIDLDVARQQGVVSALDAAGYDGLVYENKLEDAGQDSWVAFRPYQVEKLTPKL